MHQLEPHQKGSLIRHFLSAQGRSLMRLRLLNPNRVAWLGLAALTLALESAAVAPATSFAQAQPGPLGTSPVAGQIACPNANGEDYPVSGGPSNGGGWFYPQEAAMWKPICGVGPTRARGYTV